MNTIIAEDISQILDSDLPWQKLFSKNILITGANGFLSSYIVRTLLSLNDLKKGRIKIFALVRNINKAKKVLADILSRDDLKIIIQDVSEKIKVREKIDYIIHAASQASPKYFGIDPVGTLLPNIIGTYRLLKLARKKKVKGFLFFSSGEVYGAVEQNKQPIDEKTFGYLDPVQLRSCYAESKRMGESMCSSWFHQYQVPVKIVRLFHTYGPGMDLADGRVQADFVANIISKKNIIIKSLGKDKRNFCYLSDAIKGFFYVWLKGQDGQVYNIGNSNEEISIRDLAKLLIGLFPDLKLKAVFQKRKTGNSYLTSKISRAYPDTTKLSLLGWNPTVSLKEGLKRTIKSYLII